jgi:hypothetical protein
MRAGRAGPVRNWALNRAKLFFWPEQQELGHGPAGHVRSCWGPLSVPGRVVTCQHPRVYAKLYATLRFANLGCEPRKVTQALLSTE